MKLRTIVPIVLSYTALTALPLICMLEPATAQAPAADRQERLVYSPQTEDYSKPINEALTRLQQAGGGTLVIPYGKYPMRTESVIKAGEENVTLTIRGEKNASGETPLLFDTDSSKDPHTFFTFVGDSKQVCGLTVNISNLRIQGNNVPRDASKATRPFVLDEGQTDLDPNPDLPREQSYGHPFFYRDNTGYSGGIVAMNIKTIHIDRVTIKDIYGNGVFLTNYANPNFTSRRVKQPNMHSPSVTNCQILNTWQWHAPDNSGDGIMMWDIESPLIENNQIINDIAYTRWMGRCGLVLENHTADAVVKNNTISGYARIIHIENTFGGHKIIDNKLLAGDNGITLNEPDGIKTPEIIKEAKPVLIQGNIFRYDQERERYGAHPLGGERNFISLTSPRSATLDGSQILDNHFTYHLNKGVKINPWREYDVRYKTHRIYIGITAGIKGWVEHGNVYK